MFTRKLRALGFFFRLTVHKWDNKNAHYFGGLTITCKSVNRYLKSVRLFSFITVCNIQKIQYF